jgi:hypothetical protein
MYAPTWVTSIANYVRRNPVKSGAAVGGLAGLLLAAGIMVTDPTPLSGKYAAIYVALTTTVFAGAGALATRLAQGVEAHLAR